MYYTIDLILHNLIKIKKKLTILMLDTSNGAPRVKIKTKIKERVTPHPLQ
jgi:hypothetical protein